MKPYFWLKFYHVFFFFFKQVLSNGTIYTELQSRPWFVPSVRNILYVRVLLGGLAPYATPGPGPRNNTQQTGNDKEIRRTSPDGRKTLGHRGLLYWKTFII